MQGQLQFFFLLGGDSNSTGHFSGSLTVDGQSGEEPMNGLTSFSSLLSSLSSIDDTTDIISGIVFCAHGVLSI